MSDTHIPNSRRTDTALTIELRAPSSPEPQHRPIAEPTACAAPSGRYLVGEEIGCGGVGVVLEGWDAQLMRKIALKMLLEEHKNKPEVVRRFLEEARITSRLQHPGIVAIHELGFTHDNRPFFVMRLVRGETLAQILQRRDDLAIDQLRFLNIFLQACQAVAYAHSQGVIHRDLKPANIMVGAFGVVKVMDWGLAKVLGEPDLPDWIEAAQTAARFSDAAVRQRASADDLASATQVGTILGTPAYLPPEQARGEIDRVDKRADVFGLGGILCEILTGLPPYTGADGLEIYNSAVAADAGDMLQRLNACAAPLALVRLAKWCLSPEPDDRPADAAVLVEKMTDYLQSDQRRAELDLVRFFDLSLDLFCIAENNGYFRRVNENFPRILGYTAQELTSRPFIDFVHPEDRDETGLELLRVSGGEPCFHFLNRYRHADGHYLWFEWTAQSVPEERAIYAVAREVTERIAQANARRHDEQSRLHLAAVVNSAKNAIISTSLDGIVRSWNPGAERLFGYCAAEIVGQSVLRLVPEDRKDEEAEFLNRLTQSERVENFESVRQRKDGSLVPVSLTVSPVKNDAGIVVGVSKIVRDISVQKKAEAASAELLGAAAFISDSAAILSRGADLRESLQECMELAVTRLNVAFARIWTLKDESETLELQASAGLDTHLDGPHSKVSVGEYKIGMIARECKPHLTNAVIDDPRLSDRAWAVREGMVAFAGHPLAVGGQVLGVMAVFARHPLSDNLLATLRSFSDSLALAIRKQQLEDEIAELRALAVAD